ncbi:hypothetical protein [Celeribacter sp. ULVN23_4]
MKLVRFSETGAENPGLIDGKGRLRDLSDHIQDVAGDQLTPPRYLRAGDVVEVGGEGLGTQWQVCVADG